MVDDDAGNTGLHALCVDPAAAQLGADEAVAVGVLADQLGAQVVAVTGPPAAPPAVDEAPQTATTDTPGSPARGVEVDQPVPVAPTPAAKLDANASTISTRAATSWSPTDVLADPPASTIGTLRPVVIAYDATRPRTMQTRLGPSELGTPCRRQIAGKLAGIPERPDDRPPWAPLCGTAVHTLMEDVLAFENGRLGRPRWVIEQNLTVAELPGGELLTGHGDAYDTDIDTVVDWKYTGTTARRQVVRRNVANHERVGPEYRVQAHLYGRGHQNAGRPVKWVRVVFLARSHDYDESVEWTERYRPDVAQWAIDRYAAIRQLVRELDLAAHPERLDAVPAAPSEKTCAWCPFLGTACEGDRPVRMAATSAKFGDGLI